MIPLYEGRPVTQIFSYLAEPTWDNFIYFVKTFLAPYMTVPFVEEEYYHILWNEMWHNQHTLMQLPRGHSKTEYVGIWMTIYIAVCQPKNPFNKQKREIREQMILAGDTIMKQAWAERIKHFFYECPELSWLIPFNMKENRLKQNDYWNDRVLYLNNGHKILLRSINERAVRGNHVDRLHADDLVTENSTLVDQDIKERWDGAVDGVTTNKQAMVQVTGTPLRMSDILFHLKGRGYRFIKMPAIIDMEKKLIISPNRWSFENLMNAKERIGSVRFQCEYMLDPIDDSSSLIKSIWIRQCFHSSVTCIKTRMTQFKAIYLGVDFAFSDRITADNSAFVIIGELEVYDELTKQKRRLFQVLDIIIRKGMSGLEQFEFIKELHNIYQFTMIAVEENSIKAIGKHLGSYNLPLKRFWTGSSDGRNDKDTFRDFETVGKRNLILRIGNMFEQKNMIIPYNSVEDKAKAEQMYNELITFAQEADKLIEIGVHSDIGIALGYALEVAQKPAFVMRMLDVTRHK